MRRRAWLILVPALISAGLLVAYRLGPPSKVARAAAEQLKAAGEVNLGGGGFVPMVSTAEDSLFEVLCSHRAEQLLSEVFEGGSPAAKAYALCGLHYVAPKRFEHYAGRFESEQVMVRTLSGCIVGEHSSAEIVAAIRTNIFERYLPHRILIESNRARLNIRR